MRNFPLVLGPLFGGLGFFFVYGKPYPTFFGSVVGLVVVILLKILLGSPRK